MNTALNELIKFLKETYTETIGEPAIRKAQSLLPKEKEDIMKAFQNGYNNSNVDSGKIPEQYFSKTFK